MSILKVRCDCAEILGSHIVSLKPGQELARVEATGDTFETAFERFVETFMQANGDRLGGNKPLFWFNIALTIDGLSYNPGSFEIGRGENHVAVPISIEDTDVLLVVHADGRGEIYQPGNTLHDIGRNLIRCGYQLIEIFRHDWNVRESLRLDDQQLRELYEERFDETINPTLDDPFVFGRCRPEGTPLEFLEGSEEQLRRTVADILHAELPADQVRWPIEVKLLDLDAARARERNPATVWEDGSDATGFPITLSETVIPLIERALRENPFEGSRYEYNDGASDRVSGYDETPEEIILYLERPSHHRRLEAKRRLSAWAGKRHLSPEFEGSG
jgi:hypothetical protein